MTKVKYFVPKTPTLTPVPSEVDMLLHGMNRTCSKWSQIKLIAHYYLSLLDCVRVKPTISRLLEVNIGIAKRTAGNHVSAHPDGEDGSSRAEFLVEHGLGNVWVQIPYIEGGHWIARRAWIHVGRRVFS